MEKGVTSEDQIKLSALKHEMIEVFGVAYQEIGLNKLMGHIIGLLLFASRPLSLDEISEELNMSKGPVSQITRRLQDSNLIKKIWLPGDRKDYYEINPHVFSNAFQNTIRLVQSNIRIAKNLKNLAAKVDATPIDALKTRIDEMAHFYTLMDQYLGDFMNVWHKDKKKLYSNDSL